MCPWGRGKPTFSSPTQRGDYDSVAEATATLPRVKELFQQWLETVYHKHPHSGTKRAPLLHWRDEQAAMPIMSFPKNDIDVIARVCHRRKINNGRVIVDGLAYKSDALATLEHRNQKEVTVLVNELDLGFVYVQHASNPKMLIRADGVRMSYMNGLTKYEHDEVEKRLKALTQKDREELGIHSYEIARWTLWREIHDMPNSQSARRLKLLTQGEGKKKTANKKTSAMEKQGLPVERMASSLQPSHPMNNKVLSKKALATELRAATRPSESIVSNTTASKTDQIEILEL